MLVKMADWEKIRGEFTEMEKTLLNESITGEVICPRAVCIDEEKMGTVGVKVKNLIHALHDEDRANR